MPATQYVTPQALIDEFGAREMVALTDLGDERTGDVDHTVAQRICDRVNAELSAALSVRLREAHRRVGQLPVSEDEKARATRRLLAITDASKHDLQRAAQRLAALLADLDAGRIAASDEPEDGPRDTDRP